MTTPTLIPGSDPAVRPQDDLFRHVNGAWLATHEIPADRARDGSFRALHDEAEEHVRDIIQDCATGEVATDAGDAHEADTAHEAGTAQESDTGLRARLGGLGARLSRRRPTGEA